MAKLRFSQTTYVKGEVGYNHSTGGWCEEVPEFVEAKDLFEEFPQEIRAEHSLHALTGEFDGLWETFQTAAQSNAALWIVPEADIDACLDEAKFHLAWLAQPRVLDQTLSQSDGQMFAEGLMKPFKAIFTSLADDDSPIEFYAKPDFDVTQFEKPTEDA